MIRKTIIAVLTVAAATCAAAWGASLESAIFYKFQNPRTFAIVGGCIGFASYDVSNLRSAGWHFRFPESPNWWIPILQQRAPGYVLGIPLWIPFLAFAAYPTIAFIRGPVRRWRRRRAGLCVKCGYDLTGNVSGVCPECGSRFQFPPCGETRNETGSEAAAGLSDKQ